MKLRKHFFYFSPEDEGGTGSEQPVDQPSGIEPENELSEPKYFGQLNPDKAKSEEYKALYKYQKLDDLADGIIALQKEKDENAEKYKRAIILPEKTDKEGILEFAKKLGVPENASDYKVKTIDTMQNLPKLQESIKQRFKAAMLTQRQAEYVDAILLDISKAGIEAANRVRQNQIDNADAALIASYKEMTAEVDRKAAAEKDKVSFASFLQETGLKDQFEKLGLAYEPEVIKAIAKFTRTHAGQKTFETTPSGAKEKPESSNPYGYSSDFVNMAGGQHA